MFEPGSPGRSRLLVELICVDLECRSKQPGIAGPPSLADYVARFPELGSIDRLPLDLVGEAYRARRLWGDRPSHDEFLDPFQTDRKPILAELVRVDAEIAEEAAGPIRDETPRLREAIDRELADPQPDFPYLSHGDYLLRRLIGSGRMGKVYQARQNGEGRDVAIKFLRKTLLRHPGVVRRFVGEARTVAGLLHPNIVATRGLGRTAGGSYFLVMDLVVGPNLAQVAADRAVTEQEAIRWTMEVCEAIEHAHERGIVHCDLKPANILMDDRGTIRVADFGLARLITGETPWAADIEGTAPFMAPEQACRSWGAIDERTDVYGIGSVLYAILTGRPPRVGRRLADIMADVVASTPVPPPTRFRPGLSESLEGVCLRCLSNPPESRFQAVRDVRSALAACLT